MNLYAAFRHAAGSAPGPALTLPDGTSWSFADLDRHSARVAAVFSRHGLVPGDRVSIQAAKSPYWLAVYLACLRSGVICHPLNEAYQPAELKYLVTDAAPGLVVCAPQRADLWSSLVTGTRTPILTLDAHGEGSLLAAADERPAAAADAEPVIRRSADDLAVLLYSSGTTGAPKGVPVSHGNLLSNAATLIDAWGFSAHDTLLHALPVHHAHGLFVATGCAMLSGVPMLFLPRFDSTEVTRLLPDATVFMGVPTHYTRLLGEPALDRACCHRIRLFVSGSAPLSPETFHAFEARTGHRILERYGLSETGMNSANPLHGERRPGSVGRPLPGIEIRVTDEHDQPHPAGQTGAVQVRGPNVFAGYWRGPKPDQETFAPGGWFRTGDLGTLSADGYLRIDGRSKDLIITGGLNVYPREVELALEALPGVREAAVIGVPHADYGEAVIAIVAGNGTDEGVLLDALRERLAGYKRPKRIVSVAELPRNTMGKVQKTVLRERYAGIASGTPPSRQSGGQTSMPTA